MPTPTINAPNQETAGGAGPGRQGVQDLEIRDRHFRYARGLRAGWLNDWQADEGVKMDAPRLHPRGSMTNTVYDAGGRPWAIRDGHMDLPRIEASWNLVFVTVGRQRYRVRLEQNRVIDMRRDAPGARPMRQRNRLWFQVESAAWSWIDTF